MNDVSPITDCPRCKLLEAEVASLKATVETLTKSVKELTQKLEEATRSKKRQAAPFGKSRPPKKQDDPAKKPGRKPEHPLASRPEPPTEDIDRTIEVSVSECPDCKAALENIHAEVQFQSDIPVINPTITKFIIGIGTCPCCGKRVQAFHPEQASQALGAARHSIGPHAVTLAAEMKYKFGIPFRKITEFFQSTFGLYYSPGSIVRGTQKLAEKSSGYLSMLRIQLPAAKVVHADETGWWFRGDRCYLHVFSTVGIVLYRIGNRSGAVAREMLGMDFAQQICCDGYAGYDGFDTVRCNAHPLRRIRDLIQAMPERYGDLQIIAEILKAGMALSRDRSTFEPSVYASRVRSQIVSLQEWIGKNQCDERQEVARLAKHLGKYELEFTKHLFDPNLPSTNNQGERDIRPAVLLRKVGCCNRSDRGIKAFEVLASLFATAARNGMNLKGRFKELLIGLGPKYIPPELLPKSFPYKIQVS